MNSEDRRLKDRYILTTSQVSNISTQFNIKSILNINENGLCFTSPEQFEIGALLIFSNQIKAKVVWREPVNSKNNSVEQLYKYGTIVFQTTIGFSEAVEADKSLKKAERRIGPRRVNNELRDQNLRSNDRRSINRFKYFDALAHSFDKWKKMHTYLRPSQKVNFPYTWIGGQKKIILGSNSYLGLSTHPRVKEAAIKAIERFGVGTGGVPVLTGTTVLHDELCELAAKFKGTESAILYPSGYIANFACLSTILNGQSYTIFNDEKNHASLIDGCRMSDAKVRFFKHNDMVDLEKKIIQTGEDQKKLIIVDGVFSMDGNLTNLPEVHRLSQKYNSLLMVDDAHSSGVVGANGRGTAEHFNLLGKIDITTMTLSKAIGSVGGVICANRSIIKNLIHLSRPFIFSSSLPPSVCASSIEALKIIMEQPELVTKLRANVEFLVSGFNRLGFKVSATDSAIIPLILGEEKLVYKFTQRLDEMGIIVNAVSRPAVSRQLSRLRISPSATHSFEDLDQVLSVFQKVGKEFKII